MDYNLQYWGAIAGILGFFIAALALLRDIFNFQLNWSTSRNFLKRLVANRWFQLIVASALVGFAYWSLYDRTQNLENLVSEQNEQIKAIYATQTKQSVEFANQPTNTPVIQKVPVTVETEKEVTVVVEKEVTVIVNQEVTVMAPTHTPQPTYTSRPPLPTYTPLPTHTPYPEPEPPTEVVKVVTATPTPAPIPPQVLLEPYESWEQNGLVLTLDGFWFNADDECVGAVFKLKNESNHPFIVSGKARNFSAKDNMNQKWRLVQLGENSFNKCGGNINEDWITQTISPGEVLQNGCGGTCYGFEVTFAGNLNDPNVEYVDVIVEDFSQISEAAWRIPVYH
jgi:hypothetical protein